MKNGENKKYIFGKYDNLDRWSSYWHQINEILRLSPPNVLEIGAGNKTVYLYFKFHFKEIDYKCMDIEKKLEPDILGTVENIPLSSQSVEVICAFEVLEHLPFEKFNKALSELYRVSSNFVIISLPHWGRHLSLEIRLPYFKKIRWQYKFSLFPIRHKFDGEHYWEIGKRGYPIGLIKDYIKKSGFEIIKDFLVFESPYHHFFILKKKN